MQPEQALGSKDCPLSPVLFIIFTVRISRHIQGQSTGFQFSTGRGVLLLQVKEFKYISFFFRSEGKMEGENDRGIGALEEEVCLQPLTSRLLSLGGRTSATFNDN